MKKSFGAPQTWLRVLLDLLRIEKPVVHHCPLFLPHVLKVKPSRDPTPIYGVGFFFWPERKFLHQNCDLVN